MMIRIASATNNCLRVCIGRDLKPNRASLNTVMTHKVDGQQDPMVQKGSAGYIYEPETVAINQNIYICICMCLCRVVSSALAAVEETVPDGREGSHELHSKLTDTLRLSWLPC